MTTTPMSAKEKRAARKAALEARRAGGAAPAAKPSPRSVEGRAEREAVAAPTTREVYLADLRTGMTPSEVARKHGVSRQAVHCATVGYDAHRARARDIDAERRQWGSVRGHQTCTVCGEQGHNAGKHRREGTIPA